MRQLPRLGRLTLLPVLALVTAICLEPVLALEVEDKRQLEHSDYKLWNSVGSQNLSSDGKWASCLLRPADGAGTLKVREIATAKEYSIERGSGARFSYDSRCVIYTVSPDAEQVKKLRAAKVPSNLLPQTRLEVIYLDSGARIAIDGVSRFSVPAKASGWVAFTVRDSSETGTLKADKSELTETFEITPEGVRRAEKPKKFRKPPAKAVKPKASAAAKTTSESPEEKKQKPAAKKDSKKNLGTTLVVRNLESHLEQRFPYVVNYRFSEDGQHLAYTTSTPEGEEDGVVVVELDDLEKKVVLTGMGKYGQVVFSKDGKQLAFMTDRDDASADEPQWSMYVWKSGQREAAMVAGPESKGLPEGWHIYASSAPMFSEDGRRLMFRTRPKPEEDKKDKDAEEEPKAKLDIWHWQDPFLQPQQLLQVARERGRSYQAVYDLKSRKVIQLATLEMPSVSIDPRSEADVALGVAPDKYNKMRSWDTQGFSDWFLVDLKTGTATELAKMKRGSPSLSPAGKFITWWDGEAQTWFAMPTSQAKTASDMPEPVDIGAGVGLPLYNELHDTPSLPGSYGSAGWLDDDAGILLYDRWDIWQVDPTGQEKPVCITAGSGREQEIRFRRVRLDSEQRTVDLEQPQVLSALVHDTKASGYYQLGPAVEGEAAELLPLIVLDESVGGLRKAKDSDAVLFTRSTFSSCPDLWASTLDFKTTRRLTRSNPQQSQYTWGTAELVHWDASDGTPLDGILYKPEGFDASQKYPMLVYFYERNSDNLHSYYAPAAGRSIINFSFYVSRGYVVFIPDIPYKTGQPGPSAANAILPGVQSILDQGYVDASRVGMQGHSWGGYQTAYLVTQTDMFACAESGAPVSNMTSAYGGIRWGSGMSRMFQYEKTQSRIGATLWEDRESYIANSPLFFADRVKTPLLILHNDEDTAVPWYQGIELFVALRRLEKPAWMLNYNGDPHWVMSDANRMDFAQRMQQFFDHYLKGDPMPVWMAEGIPAVDKGQEFGFEYVAPEHAAESESEMQPAVESEGDS